jgi:hypothetical protein
MRNAIDFRTQTDPYAAAVAATRARERACSDSNGKHDSVAAPPKMHSTKQISKALE